MYSAVTPQFPGLREQTPGISGLANNVGSEISGQDLKSILFALEGVEPAVQDVNNGFIVDGDQVLLREAISEILGLEWGRRLRSATLSSMVDSVNLHDDLAFIEDEEMDPVFVLICLERDEALFMPDHTDSPHHSELIHVDPDGKLKATEIKPGAVIPFKASLPHAYLHAHGFTEKVLILDFYPDHREFITTGEIL